MRAERRAPSVAHVVQAIATRELLMARRRRLVKFLFIASLGPPLVLAIVLIIRVALEQSGIELDWDPVLRALQTQAFPVALLALALGTPIVASDRSEDVLFLYATRPVTPWSYALGKILAVGVPTAALLIVPGVLIAILRVGVLGERAPIGESIAIIAKVVVAALVMAIGYAGVSVGPSALTKRGRWALLLALALFVVPDGILSIFWLDRSWSLGPGRAFENLLQTLFEDGRMGTGLANTAVLLTYGALGLVVTKMRVEREMTP